MFEPVSPVWHLLVIGLLDILALIVRLNSGSPHAQECPQDLVNTFILYIRNALMQFAPVL